MDSPSSLTLRSSKPTAVSRPSRHNNLPTDCSPLYLVPRACMLIKAESSGSELTSCFPHAFLIQPEDRLIRFNGAMNRDELSIWNFDAEIEGRGNVHFSFIFP
jgi:hypothetical protein